MITINNSIRFPDPFGRGILLLGTDFEKISDFFKFFAKSCCKTSNFSSIYSEGYKVGVYYAEHWTSNGIF